MNITVLVYQFLWWIICHYPRPFLRPLLQRSIITRVPYAVTIRCCLPWTKSPWIRPLQTSSQRTADGRNRGVLARLSQQSIHLSAKVTDAATNRSANDIASSRQIEHFKPNWALEMELDTPPCKFNAFEIKFNIFEIKTSFFRLKHRLSVTARLILCPRIFKINCSNNWTQGLQFYKKN